MELNIPCKNIPNNWCRYSAVKKVENNSPFTVCIVHDFLPRSALCKGKGKVVLTVKKPHKHCLKTDDQD